VRNQTLTIKAADGTILQQPATREQLKLEEMPKPLIQAFIASEDRRNTTALITRAFSEQSSLTCAPRRLWKVVAPLRNRWRSSLLNQERSVWRKIKEVRLSQKIEQKLSKDQILGATSTWSTWEGLRCG